MIYGFSPHSPEATAKLRLEVLPCRRKGCGCVPYDHKQHSKQAREARRAAAERLEKNIHEVTDELVALIAAS